MRFINGRGPWLALAAARHREEPSNLMRATEWRSVGSQIIEGGWRESEAFFRSFYLGFLRLPFGAIPTTSRTTSGRSSRS
jgi:hypothetical protein